MIIQLNLHALPTGWEFQAMSRDPISGKWQIVITNAIINRGITALGRSPAEAFYCARANASYLSAQHAKAH